MSYAKFDDLPKGVQVLVAKAVGEEQAPSWVIRRIQALNNSSIVEMMNSEDDGESAVRMFLHEYISRNRSGYP